MYKWFRPLLFSVDPERIHTLVFATLHRLLRFPFFASALRTTFRIEHPKLEKNILGLTFKNPVGLAAGFDKDAKHIDALSSFGFGFIEIGTVTPKPQPGNPKPRLFRLPEDGALINRMGFNNDGAEAAARRLRNRTGGVIIGGNIGKNKSTPNDLAHEDYISCFNTLYEFVDYFVVNVSSPNTPGLRELQEKTSLSNLLKTVKAVSLQRPVVKPILLKIAPDLTPFQLDDIIEILKITRTDGVIATNTTISRDGLKTSTEEVSQIGQGGLSGRPLMQRSNEVIRYLRSRLGKEYPIIGVGGIMNEADAIQKLESGADLVQIYTGFIYEGPQLIKRINQQLLNNPIK